VLNAGFSGVDHYGWQTLQHRHVGGTMHCRRNAQKKTVKKPPCEQDLSKVQPANTQEKLNIRPSQQIWKTESDGSLTPHGYHSRAVTIQEAAKGQVWTRHLAPAAPASRPSLPSQFHLCPLHPQPTLQPEVSGVLCHENKWSDAALPIKPKGATPTSQATAVGRMPLVVTRVQIG